MTISVQRLVTTAVLLLVGVAAPARAQGIETVTNVPFAFTAGDTNLPRDHYRISPMPGQNGVFMVRGQRHGVVLMSRTDRSNDREHLPQSRAERKAAESVAAQAAPKSTVVVASSSLK
jgi:hypothetical protein